MELKLLWFMTFWSLAVWVVSLMALTIVNGYKRNVLAIELPGAPMATYELQTLYLPPMVKMQGFIFMFDTLTVFYYAYHMPFWDKIKSNFPTLQVDGNQTPRADCSSLIMVWAFFLISKVSYKRCVIVGCVGVCTVLGGGVLDSQRGSDQLHCGELCAGSAECERDCRLRWRDKQDQDSGGF